MTEQPTSAFVGPLSNEIRRIDGDHSLSAGALAEALAPFITDLAADVVADAWDEGKRSGAYWGMEQWPEGVADPPMHNPHRAVVERELVAPEAETPAGDHE